MVPTDDEVRQTLKRASEVRVYRFAELPDFHEWSRRYVDEDPASIAYFDGVSVELLPTELNEDHTELFEETLRDIREGLDEFRNQSRELEPTPRKHPWWKRWLGLG
jgi:hypothetical protein